MSWQKFITYLIPLVVLILYLGFQTGTIDEIKKSVTGVINISVGEKELVGTEPTIPPYQEEAIINLIAKMEEMRDSPRENCFGYVNFPNLGENIVRVTFNSRSRDGKDFTEAIIYGGAGAKQEVPRLYKEIKDIKPCVIGGSEEVAENFVGFLGDPSSLQEPYYKTVQKIEIFSLGDYNHLTVPGLSLSEENENLESSGWLFKGKKGEICFMPTNYGGIFGSNADAEGINNDFFLNSQSPRSITQLLGEGKLSWCGAENKFRTYDWVEFFAQGDEAAPLTSIPIRSRCNKYEDCGTERLRCDEYKDIRLSLHHGENCLIIASDKEAFNDCASGKAINGKIIPVTEAGFFSSSNSIVSSSINGDTDAQNLLKGIFLWHAEKNSLICNNGLWYECNDLSVDQELEIVRAAGPYSDEELFKVRCVELNPPGGVYAWAGTEGMLSSNIYPYCPGECINLDEWRCKSETFASYQCSGGEDVVCCGPPDDIILREQPVIIEQPRDVVE